MVRRKQLRVCFFEFMQSRLRRFALVLVLTVRVQVGVGVDHVAVLVAMGVDEIGAQEQFAVGEDF